YSNVIWTSSSVIAGGSENQIGNRWSYLERGHTIAGGERNTIDYDVRYSTIAGGSDNYLDDDWSTVGGGWSNTIWWSAGDGHTIAGGENNQISAFWGCTISGGAENRIGAPAVLGDGSVCATIAGGQYNTITNGSFSAIGGGSANTARGKYNTISGGQSNAVPTGLNAAVGGGFSNTATADYATVPGGAQATARLFGQMAYASGQFSSPGDAQSSLFVCRGVTTNATQGELFLDGASARMVVPTNSTWSFEILISGRAANGNSAAFRFLGAIKNNNGALSLLGTPLKNALGQDVPSWDASLAADTPNQDLSLRVTGQASTSIRWVANVRTTEVAY
ncbi:MAG TPA: hypothetical protein VHI52_21755, partial [Verrucomicrobiae bacterium]|nr:hypothetical protein [Verrucomicrobiae bacterium]